MVACGKNHWIVVEELKKAETEFIERNRRKTPSTVNVKRGVNKCSIL